MFCHICGTPLPERAVFCPGCGRSLSDHPIVRMRADQPPEDTAVTAPVIPETEESGASVIILPPPVMPEPIPEEAAPAEDPVPAEEPAQESPVSNEPEPCAEPVPPVRRRRPWLIPTLIMTGLFLAGSAIHFIFPFPAEDTPVETTAPVMENNEKPPLPNRNENPSENNVFVATDEDCFEIHDGAVSFLPEKYRGGPILVIPDEIDGQTVTTIANTGFHTLEGITTVILPDTLEFIEDNAFEGCTELRGIYIPSTVRYIGRRAFFGCIALESVSIPAGTSHIGTNAFDGCASLIYIFYEGDFEDWIQLYNEYITPFTYACCSDGEYYHGVYSP